MHKKKKYCKQMSNESKSFSTVLILAPETFLVIPIIWLITHTFLRFYISLNCLPVKKSK